MPKLLPRVPLLIFLAACVDLSADEAADPGADVTTASTAAPLVAYTDNPMGNLSLVAPAPNTVRSSPNAGGLWKTIDGASALAYARAGDNLEVDVSAEIAAQGPVYLRVLVDGQPASPGDVLFRSGGIDGVRSFRFVQSGLSAGGHVIELQWTGDPAATITDHDLTVRTASPTWGSGRLAVASVEGYVEASSSASWIWMSGMAVNAVTDATRDLVITSSVESYSSSGQLMVRALVDGVVVGDAQVHASGTSGAVGARSVTFVAPSVPAGTHLVLLQWAVKGGSATITDRSMTVYSGSMSQVGGGLSAWRTQGTTTTLSSTSWTLLAEGSMATWEPSAIAAITFSSEVYGAYTGVRLRALVDGEVASPGEVLYAGATGSSNAWQSATYTFQVKHRLLGLRNVRIEARLVSAGWPRVAYVRDRALSIQHTRRHGVDFAQPMSGMQPRDRAYTHIVICYDAESPWGARRFVYPELETTFLGLDGRKNVADWFHENTDGHVRAGAHFFHGCYDVADGHGGGWYWNEANGDLAFRFGTLHRDALTRADADIDFQQFDTNGDRVLTQDEVVISIVKPQLGLVGQCCASVNVTVDGGVTMTIPYVDLYLQPPGANPSYPDPRRNNVGLAAHELSHALLGADDLYIDAPGDNYSVMSAYDLATHLDPAHKLLAGAITPAAIEVNDWSTQTLSLPAIESSREALLFHDRNRPNEIFLVENRWIDASNYDGFEVPAGSAIHPGGVAIWRVSLVPDGWLGMDNRRVATLRPAPSPADPAPTYQLRWSDGTLAPIELWVSSPALGETVGVHVRRL